MIWTDDTPVTVLGGEKPGSHTGRFWVYIGPTVFPYDVYVQVSQILKPFATVLASGIHPL